MIPVDYIEGQTFHGRRGAIRNAFRYSIDYVLLDMDVEVSAPWGFARNSARPWSVRDVDHGGAPKQGQGVAWVRSVLDAHGIGQMGRIQLLTQPRALGYVFNPVSFWLCHDRDGVLRVVIAEVNNTFGDRHSYLCHHDDLAPLNRNGWVTAQKIFHVSPFQTISGGYRFRFDITRTAIDIVIEFGDGAGGGVVATLSGPRRSLRNRDIAKAYLRRPLGSLRVMGLILWQAMKLRSKGAKYRDRPVPPVQDVSR